MDLYLCVAVTVCVFLPVCLPVYADEAAPAFVNRTVLHNPMCAWVNDYVFTSAGKAAFDCFMVQFIIMIKYSKYLILNPASNVSDSVRELLCAYRFREMNHCEGVKVVEMGV